MLLESLNKSQEEAAKTVDGFVEIIAGAGSGKTRTITYRIAHMVKNCGINPESILALTFTTKAANEMKERIAKLAGSDTAVTACTFHSFAFRMVKMFAGVLGYEKGISIFDDADQEATIKRPMRVLKSKGLLLEALESSRTVKSAINIAKEMEICTPEELYSRLANGRRPKEIAEQMSFIFKDYQETLKICNAVDFADLMILLKKILKTPELRDMIQSRYKYFIVDEYQDTNKIQDDIINLLASGSRNLCVVGDPDQSIYGFRGSSMNLMDSFRHEHKPVKIIKLEENYRSTPEIIKGANAVISNNPKSFDKKLVAQKESGAKIKFTSLEDEAEEAAYVAEKIKSLAKSNKFIYDDFTILYRTNFQARAFEKKLIARKIPYKIFGEMNFFQRKEIKNILAFLRIYVNHSDGIAFERICSNFKIGIGPVSFERLLQFKKERKVNFFELFSLYDEMDIISKNAREYFKKYSEMFDEMKEREEKGGLILDIFKASGYLDSLKEEDEEERMENIADLSSSFDEYFCENEGSDIEDFLAEISMYASGDLKSDKGFVKLMTAHKSKGLEFNYVFLCGASSCFFPLEGWDDKKKRKVSADVCEERRLFYVAMTRAMEVLEITAVRNRLSFPVKVSQFVRELSDAGLEYEIVEAKNKFKNYFTRKSREKKSKKNNGS